MKNNHNSLFNHNEKYEINLKVIYISISMGVSYSLLKWSLSEPILKEINIQLLNYDLEITKEYNL